MDLKAIKLVILGTYTVSQMIHDLDLWEKFEEANQVHFQECTNFVPKGYLTKQFLLRFIFCFA